jgi:protein-tyrosine-phosphatase
MSAPSLAAVLPSVLFVCGRNAIRSPMGEALWRKQFGPKAEARSCGVIPAAFADGFMLAVMLEKGIDLSDASPIALRGIGEPSPDMVISVSRAADRMAQEYCEETGAAFLAWPVDDPSETGGGRDMRLEAYRKTRDSIAERIAQWAKARKSA